MTDLSPARSDGIAFFIITGALLFVVHIQLLAALLAGLLVHELVHALAPKFFNRQNLNKAKLWTLLGLIGFVVLALSGAVLAVVLFLGSEQGSLAKLLTKLAEVIEKARGALPSNFQQWLPEQGSDLGEHIVDWLRAHAKEVQTAGGVVGHTVAVAFVGMVIGALISLTEVTTPEQPRYLAAALGQSVGRLATAFRCIVFAQIRISALNTLLTAIFLLGVLPLVGVGHLPLTKTMILITFLVGLLPVVGNLISNAVIMIIALTHSIEAALGCLLFLVVIHKLEYFVNARIIGNQIRSSAWELLTAMLVMQSIFGIPGVIAAPIFYAYFKSELQMRNWI